MKENLFLGIELGSTRIKSVLIDAEARVVASGAYEWENILVDGLWSYPLSQVEEGLQTSFASLSADYLAKTGKHLHHVGAIGISAMMHGYLAFNREGELLAPFRTWRNTNAAVAAAELSGAFSFNVPMRWSVSQFYQSVLDGEEHVKEIDFLTTLSGYVHYKLTGNKVIGVGDASGMFPISGGDYDRNMLDILNARLSKMGHSIKFESVLPKVLSAGENAGVLTESGARFLDPTGALECGCPLCPPEGDAGTGMVATNSTAPRTANVSAGTSAFLMAVLDKELNGYYPEIDVVTTPDGSPVAMVHVNNFASEITAWTELFGEVIALGGGNISKGALYDALYKISSEGDDACGGMLGYNFLAGEPIVGVDNGLLTVMRTPGGRLSLANFMKMQIYSALGALAMGVKILDEENVEIASVCGHGGFFKCERVGQAAMSAALKAPVTVMQNAGEGGAWGIALLALFTYNGGKDLGAFLGDIFADSAKSTVEATDAEKADFDRFMEIYKKGLAAERYSADILA